MPRFYVRCISTGPRSAVVTSAVLEAATPIEAIRAAATKARCGGRWEAFKFDVAKDIKIERAETVRVLFSEPT